MQNVVYAFSSVETSPDTRKSQSLLDFVENYALFFFRLRYLRRLHARFSPFYMQNVVLAFPESTQAQTHSNHNNLLILSKTDRYFSPFEILTTFTLSVHCIMRAERCTLVFELRNHPRYTQIKINTRFCRNLCFISLPFEIFTTFTRSFLCILHAERTARVFHRRYRLRHTQITIIYPFCPKLTVISHRLRYLRRLHARFSPFSMQYVLHAFSTVDTSPETRKLQ